MSTDVGKDFFITYTSADKKWAEWIAWQLEEAQYSTTFVIVPCNSLASSCNALALLYSMFYTSSNEEERGSWTTANWSLADVT